ncbi:hypothetical protein ACA910_020766 [Epithemia clementina (nom. ined.)]
MADLKAQLHQLRNRDPAPEAPNIDAHISCIISAVLQAKSLPSSNTSSEASRHQGKLQSHDAHLFPDSVLDMTIAQEHSFDDGASYSVNLTCRD